MGDNIEKYGVAAVIVFGALIVAGLMAATLVMGHRNGFLFALGAATAGWIIGHAMIFNLPRVHAILTGLAILMAIASTLSLVM